MTVRPIEPSPTESVEPRRTSQTPSGISSQIWPWGRSKIAAATASRPATPTASSTIRSGRTRGAASHAPQGEEQAGGADAADGGGRRGGTRGAAGGRGGARGGGGGKRAGGGAGRGRGGGGTGRAG